MSAVIVVGAGPGVSGSLARLYAAEGWSVGLVGNDEAALADLAASLHGVRVERRVADVSDPVTGGRSVEDLAERLGRVDVLHVNPSVFREADPLRLDLLDLLDDVAVGVGALLVAVQAAHPWMSAGARVSATGSMAADEPWHRAASLGVQKAGLRNLVISLDRTLEADGIRAVSVTVRGALSSEGTFTPDKVAEAILAATRQDPHEWRAEVSYP